jgi:hypothetical protein
MAQTAQLNLGRLADAYEQIRDYTDDVDDRRVVQYRKHPQQTAEVIAQTVRHLFEDNPMLLATFVRDETLLQQVEENPVLTINGRAVSLATEYEAPTSAPEHFVDLYFSLGIIRQVTECPGGCPLDKERAQQWVLSLGSRTCPGCRGPIGDLDVNPRRQRALNNFVRRRQTELGELRQLGDDDNSSSNTPLINTGHQQQVAIITRTSRASTALAGGGGVIAGARIALTAVPQIANAGGQIVRAVIPGVGLVWGIGAATWRWRNNDRRGAVAEIAAGIAGLFPGIGTVIAITIQVGLVGREVICPPNYAGATTAEEQAQEYEATLNGAAGAFGLTRERLEEIEREEFDRIYRRQTQQVHFDTAAVLGEHLRNERLNTLTLNINELRNFVYQHRGWNQ